MISARMALASLGVTVATFWFPSTRITPLRWVNAEAPQDFKDTLFPNLEIVCQIHDGDSLLSRRVIH
jgi:hypothetical protein